MMHNSLINEIIKCIAEFLSIDESGIKEETHLQDDLGLSSFDMMELSCELEEQFNVKIPAEKLSEIKRIGDIKTLIEQRG